MSLNIFYSWQSDLPNKLNRGFIREALDEAVRAINADLGVEEAVRVDQDTIGVPGSPPIAETILRKIENCAVFVPDVSFVCGMVEGRRSPNPNVMIEYGYALKVCGDPRLIPVFNEAFGDWEKLPFDMRHKRRPILFNVSEDLPSEDRLSVRKELAKKLEAALREARNHGLFEVGTERVPAKARSGVDGSFLQPDEALGRARLYRLDGKDGDITLRGGARIYMRLWPKSPIPKKYGNVEVYNTANSSQLRPMCSLHSGGWNYGRNIHGAFSFYTFNSIDNEAVGITQLFKNGEIWGIDTYYLNIPPRKETYGHEKFIPTTAIENDLVYTLGNYLDVACNHLKWEVPLEFRVGMASVKGYELAVPQATRYERFVGRIFEQSFEHASLIENCDVKADDILLPFFQLTYDVAGEVRPGSNN